MRVLALALGIAYLVANVGAALFMSFFATFPWENQTPEEKAADDWLVGAGVMVAFLAVVTLIALILNRPGWATVPYAANAALGLALLNWGLGESDHSDGKLIVSTLGIELTGLGAVALRARGRSHPD
jgi:hypothetical protein